MAANDPAGPIPTHFLLVNDTWVMPPGSPPGWYTINMADGLVEYFTPLAEIIAARRAKKPRTFTEAVE